MQSPIPANQSNDTRASAREEILFDLTRYGLYDEKQNRLLIGTIEKRNLAIEIISALLRKWGVQVYEANSDVGPITVSHRISLVRPRTNT